MSLSCGFYNSVDHDRRYDARDFSRLINCLINDGIMANVDDCFVVNAVKSSSGGDTNQITIGSGLAWFNNTWSYNDTAYLMDLPLSDVVSKRIDAVVLEIDETNSVRDNRFLIVSGTAGSTPQKPILINTELIHQHPLCYITRSANIENISQANIENVIGTDETPFAVGVLQVISIDKLLGQWQGQMDDFTKEMMLNFSQWASDQQDEFENWSSNQKRDFAVWYAGWKKTLDGMLASGAEELKDWNNAAEKMFSDWFSQIQTELSGDVAGNLQLQINSDEIGRILTAGFPDGVKTISEDGRIIKTVASDGRTLTKTFNSSFSELVAVLAAKDGGLIARQVKQFDSSGRIITTSVTYM